MNVAIVDTKFESFSYENHTVRIDAMRIPLHTVGAIVCFGSGKTHTGDLCKIADEGVRIFFIDGRNRIAQVGGLDVKNSELKLRQYRAYEHKRLELAKWMVVRKIDAMYMCAFEWCEDEASFIPEAELAKTRSMIEKASTVAELMGLEGAVSAKYFDVFFASIPKLWHKAKRSKRPPKDRLNALMSFGYMQMYHYLSVRLSAVGLEPGIGFLHTPFRDHHALASDLMEGYRPMIDRFMRRSIVDGVVTLEDFAQKGGVYLRYSGRKAIWKPWKAFLDEVGASVTALLYELKERMR